MKHLKTFSLVVLTLYALGVSSDAWSAATERVESAPDWKTEALRRINEPLKVDIRWNVNSSQEEPGMILSLEDGNVTFVQTNSGGQASVAREALGSFYFGSKFDEPVLAALRRVGRDLFTEQDLDALRDVTYPMCRFLSIPEANCNMHQTVLKFCQGLIQLGYLEEAAFYFQYIPMELVGLNFEELALQLAHLLLDEGNLDLGVDVVKGVPVEQINAANLASLAEFAHRLREFDEYRIAMGIYKRMLANSQQADDEPQYWFYYCEIALNEAQEDHEYIQKITTLDPSNRFFSLQQLIAGRYYLDRNFVDQAMRAIAKGVAFAKPVDRWTPELMYYSSRTYRALKMPEVADAILKEIVLFFPHSHWAELSQKILPKVQPSIINTLNPPR
ncbi:MAG: tetratricopeptide (TPR) repeat protein [Lentimonas sp.]|jgi:tetratricopeptide (TPR) repeat protein